MGVKGVIAGFIEEEKSLRRRISMTEAICLEALKNSQELSNYGENHLRFEPRNFGGSFGQRSIKEATESRKIRDAPYRRCLIQNISRVSTDEGSVHLTAMHRFLSYHPVYQHIIAKLISSNVFLWIYNVIYRGRRTLSQREENSSLRRC